MSFAEIEAEYDISAEDIRAALEFANELIEREEFHVLPS
jgi:uncharacterized protein (DUF433 family)